MPPRLIYWTCAVVIFLFGCVLRLKVSLPEGYQPGFDEQVYMTYVGQLDEGGLGGFSGMVKTYITEVKKAEFVYLPPFRLAYTVPSWLLFRVFHMEDYQALRLVSAFASCGYVLVGFFFARRWLSPRLALAALALLACAPLQIHLGQFAFIDAVAGFWAILVVGCAWESLQQPRHWGWLAGAAVSYFGLCLAKQETAVFIALFLFVAVLAARWLRWSDVAPWWQAVALAVAGLAAVVFLAMMSGGFAPMIEAFSIYHERAQTLPYTIQTGDGPWHRYLLEYLLINPLTFLLAVGFVLRADFSLKVNAYLLVLIGVTGLVMTSIPFGMNIRHTVMWDLPLALFAVQCIAALTTRVGRSWIWAAASVGLVCLTELRMHTAVFQGNGNPRHHLYDTDLRFMLRNVRILRL